jgi:peptidoglycan hydrolase-like protein with peptidoglycan-binding domain
VRYIGSVLCCLVLSLGLAVHSGRAFDPQLQQAQQTLSHLGYDPGVADGIYGQRTRQALEAFQQAQQLPVTGVLDTPTLQALDLATSAAPTATPPALPAPRSPLHIVLDYLRFHTLQPARTLPYVTEHFRNGLTPQLWLERMMQARRNQEYTYLAWKVQRLDITDTQATVQVQTQVRVQGHERSQHEVFTLLRTATGEWLIDDWRAEVLPLGKETTPTGS